MNKGTRVRRGPDWRYGGQDCSEGRPCEGVIISDREIRIGNHYYVRVKWDNGYKHLYRVRHVEGKKVDDVVEALGKFFNV